MNYFRGIIISAIIASIFAYTVSGGSKTFIGIPLMIVMVFFIHLVQVLVFIPSKIFNSERFYDLTGSLTYITSIIIAACVGESQASFRQRILVTLVCLWASRLGSFLFYRILKVGEDSRFRKIKKNPMHYFFAWFVQGLWVTMTSGPAMIIVSQESPISDQKLSIIEITGLVLWVLGFVIEVIADFQKFMWNKNQDNKGKFICHGLWAYSRHPNYCGEIILWTGMSIFCFSSLSGGEYVSLISPVFVYLLLTKLSGVPILENKANARWGENKEYQQYKRKTPIMFPFFHKPSENQQKTD